MSMKNKSNKKDNVLQICLTSEQELIVNDAHRNHIINTVDKPISKSEFVRQLLLSQCMIMLKRIELGAK